MYRETLLDDVIFKIVFTNPVVLRAFLNDLLGLTGEDAIREVEVLNPFNSKEFLYDKGVILDIRATDHRGHLYNIELQMLREKYYIERSLYYGCGLYYKQLKQGEGYDQLKRSICISLLNFIEFPDLDEFHTRFRLCEVEHGFELSEILEFQYCELPKLDLNLALVTPKLRWLHVIKFAELYLESKDLPLPLQQQEELKMAIDLKHKAYAEPDVQEILDSRHKAELAAATRLSVARSEGVAEGRTKGIELGRTEGIAMGRTEGIAVGRTEGIVEGVRRVAEGLLREGLPHDLVSKSTGLTAAEVEALARDL